MGKGEETRQAILERAVQQASQVGLGGLTIGSLAAELGLSKSGLFAHFQSKESLEAQALAYAAELFVQKVVRPALKAPRGEARVRSLFEHWLEWDRARVLPGGCIFVAAAAELDDQEGPARDELVAQQKSWLELLAGVAKTAAQMGEFRSDLDCEQFAHEANGLMLAYHHSLRLLRDPQAEARTRQAFERLLAASRAPGPTQP
ncbi:MAG TPA: TetR/AcrR family transcriptional regulator [Thermoanaerobaculia bacterium]|nr:TetR/AcrR family transcriptional regulator [Thermoanaerobaculia bacterium]